MSQFDRDARDFNRKYGIAALMREIQRQDSRLTMKEAKERATVLYTKGHRASVL
jgi:hypothetical protein